MKVYVNAFALTLLTVLLGGCLSASRVPEDHFYKLPDIEQAQCGLNTEGVIAVAPLHAYSLHGERALVYIETDKPLELKRYHYHHWMESPTRLIQSHLMDFLERCHAGASIIAYAPGETYDTLVRGKILNLERTISQTGSEVVVGLELEFSGKNMHGFHHEYRVRLPVNGSGVHDTVSAIGKALLEVYGKFTADLQTRLGRNPTP